MDNQEQSVTIPSENKFNLKQYKGDIYFISFLMICIILFPLGVLAYFWGRMNFMLHLLVLATFALWIFMLTCILTGIIRLFRKNTPKKRNLIFIEICLSIIFFISYFLPHVMKLNLYDSGDPFLCGYRDRIRSKLDIKETQNWLKTQFQKYNKDEFYKKTNLRENLPDCLKPLRSDGPFSFGGDDNGNPTIEQICGATFLDWGLIIEMEDMPYPHSEDFKKLGGFWLSVAPGDYVYAE